MKIAGFIVGSIGILFLIFGGYLFLHEVLFLQRAALTSAIVTGNKRYTYTGQVNEYGVQHYYCSQFQFQTKDGRSVSYEETDAQCAELDSPPHYQVGDKVQIYYDPANPGTGVQIRSFREQYRDAIAAVVGGALFLLVGLILLGISLWRSRRTASSRMISRSVH